MKDVVRARNSQRHHILFRWHQVWGSGSMVPCEPMEPLVLWFHASWCGAIAPAFPSCQWWDGPTILRGLTPMPCQSTHLPDYTSELHKSLLLYSLSRRSFSRSSCPRSLYSWLGRHSPRSNLLIQTNSSWSSQRETSTQVPPGSSPNPSNPLRQFKWL